jgi:nucleoside-diphosphate-sugar epimerase
LIALMAEKLWRLSHPRWRNRLLASETSNLTLQASLDALATGRSTDLFLPDLQRCWHHILDRIENRRLLVLGGAGSIGAATSALLSQFQPAALHVVDQNENALAELVRDLRSRPSGLHMMDFRALPLDYGSAIMCRFLMTQRPYDLVLNFAALKHVRSEKDTCSLLQMLDTNVIKPIRCWRWLKEAGSQADYFSVSTDKAADPGSLMGASKRIMEHLIFSATGSLTDGRRVTSARFANVAFSSGSLLESFLRRFEKCQPLVCPNEVSRFFISLREAGQLCTLAATCGPDRHIVIPRLSQEKDLRLLTKIAIGFLRLHGLEPETYEDEERARTAVHSDLLKGRYPLLLTPLDTTGEKDAETFVAQGEQTHEFGMSSLVALRYNPAQRDRLSEFLESLSNLIDHPDLPIDRRQIASMISEVVPEMKHLERSRFLDDRM